MKLGNAWRWPSPEELVEWEAKIRQRHTRSISPGNQLMLIRAVRSQRKTIEKLARLLAAAEHPERASVLAVDPSRSTPDSVALPRSSGLSDERLAEDMRGMPDRYLGIAVVAAEVLAAGAVYDADALHAAAVIHHLVAEVSRTRDDAALGARLREAFSTVPSNAWITLSRIGVHIECTNGAVIVNDECQALAALLSRASAERTKTP